jgi:MoaA/NifB/PqqE/SkfB family radical SAM enzyme
VKPGSAWAAKAKKATMLVRSAVSHRIPALYAALRLRPAVAWINPTDNCNMRCVMCNQWRTHKSDELTLPEWDDVFAQMHEVGIRKVGLNGGEPLLVGDVASLIASAVAHGLATDLTTSGFLLTDRRLEALIAAGLPSMTLSIDGVGPRYESIRGRDWTRVEAAARRVATAQAAGRIRGQIGFVLMKTTLDHVDEMLRFARELNLPIAISLVDSTPYFFRVPENERDANGHWIGPEDMPRLLAAVRKIVAASSAYPGTVATPFASLAYAPEYFQDPLQKSIPCTVSQTRLFIDGHGEVFGGCWSMQSWGCVRRQKLRDILASAAYRDAHRAMFYKDCPGCSCGYDANVRYSAPWQLRQQVYVHVASSRQRIASEPAVRHSGAAAL